MSVCVCVFFVPLLCVVSVGCSFGGGCAAAAAAVAVLGPRVDYLILLMTFWLIALWAFTFLCSPVINCRRCYELFMQQPQGAHFVAALPLPLPLPLFVASSPCHAFLPLFLYVAALAACPLLWDFIRPSDPIGSGLMVGSLGLQWALLSLNVSIDIADYTGQ